MLLVIFFPCRLISDIVRKANMLLELIETVRVIEQALALMILSPSLHHNASRKLRQLNPELAETTERDHF